MGVIVALALLLFAPHALAQGEGTENLGNRSVREVLADVDQWKLPLLGVASLLVLALLLAGGLVKPGGFAKAGARDLGPVPSAIWIFAALVVLLAMYSAKGVLTTTGALDRLGGEDGLTDAQSEIVTTLVAYALGGVAGLGMLFVLHKSAPESGMRVSGLDLPLGFGCFLLAFPIVQLSAIGAFEIYQGVTEGDQPDPIAHDVLRSIRDQFAGGTQDMWTWLTILAAVAGAPLVEELIYRVFLQSALLKLFKSPWVSIILSALVFAGMHRVAGDPSARVPWHALIPLFTLGVTMGVAYERTRRVGVPIAMHMCFNALMIALVVLGAEGPAE